MLLTFCLQVCFVLVSSNPLFDLKVCPTTTYPNYGNADQLFINTGYNNPYLQNLLLYNQLTPNSPSNAIIPNQLTNLFLPNQQFYMQNAFDTPQISEPFENQKVLSNFNLVPEEYNSNDGNRDRKVSRNSENNFKTNNKKKRRKQRKNTSNIHQENGDGNNRKRFSEIKQGEVNEDVNTKSRSKRKKSKKNRQRNKIRPITTEKIAEERDKENGEILKPENNDIIRLDERKINKNVPIRKKCEPEVTTALTSKSEPKKEVLGFDNVPVCFDINEDCTDLDCRHTRNKDVNTRNNKPISKPQQNSPNNFMNLMNTFGGNTQISPNFFNNMNYPFNFDYLYQTPQTTNAKTREPGNRRRNKKRKPQNRQTNSNRKVKEFKSTTESCDKVVELVPETTEVEISTIASITTTVTEEIDSTPAVEKIEKVIQETHLNNFKSNNEKPTTVDVEHVTEVTKRDENILLFDNYNDIMDEYYPDFTSDKSYLASKEDYEFTNFQDRYYYAYGDETELNRERRKYESHRENQLYENNNKINTNVETEVLSEPNHNQNSDIAVTTESTETYVEKEQEFPSSLEFPGFKTEMVDKEEYFSNKRNYESETNNYGRNKMFSYSDLKEIMEANENYNNNVETVFANSKVYKYGTQVNEATTSVPQPVCRKEHRKTISDNKPVIIVAKSIHT